MKSETHVWVHLPNGDKFEMDRNKSNFSPLSEEAVSELRNLFASASDVEFNALPEKNNGLMKGKTIILWGDVLKNSWIEIVNY
jgi:hypothetical protein